MRLVLVAALAVHCCAVGLDRRDPHRSFGRTHASPLQQANVPSGSSAPMDKIGTVETQRAYAEKLKVAGAKHWDTALADDEASVMRWYSRWVPAFLDPNDPWNCAVGDVVLCTSLLQEDLRFLSLVIEGKYGVRGLSACVECVQHSC